MKNPLQRLMSLIKKSTLDLTGKHSSTRVSSYFILGSILTSCAVFICIDIGNSIVKWRNGETYTIPWDHIALFSLMLTHHLILLGLKKATDNSIINSNGAGSFTNSMNQEKNTITNTIEENTIINTKSTTSSGSDSPILPDDQDTSK